MHGERKERSSSIPSQSMLTDETSSTTSTLLESACLPIGCSVSAKYRGAFCSAQVKTIDRQVKLKVILLDSNNTVIISEDQVVQPASLRIGSTITVRLSSTVHHDVTPHLSRSALTTLMNANDHYDEKNAIIKQIYDNSIYTVVFNDGDEKSLRRSSLCLQGIRLYQTRIDQQKLIEDLSTSTVANATNDNNDTTSVVAVRRHGNNSQQVFPALILKRKSLADYIWVRSFLDGREYIVHKHNDIEPYKSNSQIQSQCRSTSKQATLACDKFIKYNQTPNVWQKKKTRRKHDDDSDTSDSNSSSSESDVDNSDAETIEEKDSFIAQLIAFMDDRGTPINTTPKVHQYDLDLHRLFKIVRMLGGYNKVTRNDHWGKIYVKMGLPNEPVAKSARLMEQTYKKYLHAYEDLSKKLGTMTIPSAYFGARTNVHNDSRRSLFRVRRQSEEKIKPKSISAPNKQQSRKTQSTDSKQLSSSSSSTSSTKTQSVPLRRKTIIIRKTKASTILSSSTSDSDSSDGNEEDDDKTISSCSSSTNKIKKPLPISTKKIQSSAVVNEKKKLAESKHSVSSPAISDNQKKRERSTSTSTGKPKAASDSDEGMTPVIKIKKIPSNVLPKYANNLSKTSTTPATNRASKPNENVSKTLPNKAPSQKQKTKVDTSSLTNSESLKDTLSQSTKTVPKSPSPPVSTTDDSSTVTSVFATIQHVNDRIDYTPAAPPTFHSLIPSSPTTNQCKDETDTVETNTNKRSFSDGNFESNLKLDEHPSPSKRSRHSLSSQASDEVLNQHSCNKQTNEDHLSINNDPNRLTYEDLSINDILLIRSDLADNKQCYARCIDKNKNKKEIFVHYKGLDSKYDEWIELDRVLQRDNDVNFIESEQITTNVVDSSATTVQKGEEKINNVDQDTGIWRSLELASMNQGDTTSSATTSLPIESNEEQNPSQYQSRCILPDNSAEERLPPQDQPVPSDNVKTIARASIENNEYEQSSSVEKPMFVIHTDPTEQPFSIENILMTSDAMIHRIQTTQDIMSTPATIESVASIPVLNTTLENRRTASRPLRRRTFRDSNNSLDSYNNGLKKRAKLDTDTNSNINNDNSSNNSDPAQIASEQSLEGKRIRTVGRRGAKRTVNQPDNENDDLHSNSPSNNASVRQKLEDIFKHRTSRYNFLDLNNNLTGDSRLSHLKDRMRQCQKVFFNLKSALSKNQKQRKLFLQRQKLSNTDMRSYEIPQSTTNEVLLPSTCT